MPWHASLDLTYRRQDSGKTLCEFAHNGPLRVLKSLYPEGPGVCHNVLVHPPSGLVGGDALDIRVQVAEGAHALVTTPGATRFYRSEAGVASQHVRVQAADHARLEWLPLENIAYSGCQGVNALHMELAPTAQVIGWDILALGLPAADMGFERGRFEQSVCIQGLWLERGVIDAADTRLLRSPLGLHGKQCLSLLFFASGTPLPAPERERLLQATRALLTPNPLARWAGLTWPNPQVIVLRVLANFVEPAAGMLRQVWGLWRQEMWGIAPATPRIWNV
mgnify:CR=1 FL=1